MQPRWPTNERDTILDDRLLHMTREEAGAYLDEYIVARGLDRGQNTDRAGTAERPLAPS